LGGGAKNPRAGSVYRFRRHDKIGANDAQEDRNFLHECFVHKNDELKLIQDTLEPECIILGRTGAGKTALLSMLKRTEDKVAVLSLDDLALNHLSNSPALKYYVDLEINLDLFFRVLWRHVFAVELVNLFSAVSGTTGINNLLQKLRDTDYRQPYQKKGREYLLKYPEFWNEPEKRLVQETERVEEDLTAKASAGLQAKILDVSGELQYSSKLTQEEKAEITRIGSELVNQKQMQDLSAVVRLLRDELQYDAQKKYFITIDKLDRKWVEDPLRYKLIRALIETARDLNEEIDQLKIILAIRKDLFERVFEVTRTYGDQREKYDSLCIKLLWNHKQLIDVVEKRVNQLIYNVFAKRSSIKFKDILPSKILGQESTKYFLERTLSTPRDAIAFFNYCISQAEGKSKISQSHVNRAERIYSHQRLGALADEWSADFPTLMDAANVMKGMRKNFLIVDIDRADLQNKLQSYMAKVEHSNLTGPCYDLAYAIFAEADNAEESLYELFWVFSKVGILGIQPEDSEHVFWSSKGDEIHKNDIAGKVKIHIHPGFYTAFSIRS